MGIRNYVLKNNEKPATHFISVWNGGTGFVFEMKHFHLIVYRGTIAIFKIRMK